MKGPRFYGLLQPGKRLHFSEGGTENSLEVTVTPCPAQKEIKLMTGGFSWSKTNGTKREGTEQGASLFFQPSWQEQRWKISFIF